MTKIELDVSYDESEHFNDVMAELKQGRPIRHRIVVEHGPAGGCPIVEFEGAYDDIKALLVVYLGEGNLDELPVFLGEDTAAA